MSLNYAPMENWLNQLSGAVMFEVLFPQEGWFLKLTAGHAKLGGWGVKGGWCSGFEFPFFARGHPYNTESSVLKVSFISYPLDHVSICASHYKSVPLARTRSPNYITAHGIEYWRNGSPKKSLSTHPMPTESHIYIYIFFLNLIKFNLLFLL